MTPPPRTSEALHRVDDPVRVRHVLGLSGGRDSAALAVHMRQTRPDLKLEYFFTDTGKELPEVYDYLHRLEGFLGDSITYLNPGRDFDFWLRQYNHFLPSPRTRWCTRQLKIKPFEDWIAPTLEAGDLVVSYVAIRADERDRMGYQPTRPGMTVKLPFVDGGIDRAGVTRILEEAGLGLPAYYRWRSRSGCTFCFYQQKIEWVRLMREHPQAFAEAQGYEKTAVEHGSPFTWSNGESLEELARPERVEAIEVEHARRRVAAERRRRRNPLAAVDDGEEFDVGAGCLVCHK